VQECAVDAVAITEGDGRRVVVRRSERSTDGEGPCRAEARIETRSCSPRPGRD
jgi:hypothetical protein